MRTRSPNRPFPITPVLVGVLVTAATAVAGGSDEVRVYYFGNSLTGMTNPLWHAELGLTAGKRWVATAKLGAGWPLWKHRAELQRRGVVFSPGNAGHLTIDPELSRSGGEVIRSFFRDRWDAVVLQPYGNTLRRVRRTIGGRTYPRPTDFGDLACASDIIDAYLELNSEGRVLIYQDWPPMAGGSVPPAEELPEWANRPGAPVRPGEFPDRENFDYEREWLRKKYVNNRPREPKAENIRCRDYHTQLFDELRRRYPSLDAGGRLTVIPTGDVFLELDRAMRDGLVDGIGDIGEFYTDSTHIRAGLPRYVAAATFFACLFGVDPAALDAAAYDDPARYGDDPYHDEGVPIAITHARKAAVDAIIWEVVRADTHSGVGVTH